MCGAITCGHLDFNDALEFSSGGFGGGGARGGRWPWRVAASPHCRGPCSPACQIVGQPVWVSAGALRLLLRSAAPAMRQHDQHQQQFPRLVSPAGVVEYTEKKSKPKTISSTTLFVRAFKDDNTIGEQWRRMDGRHYADSHDVTHHLSTLHLRESSSNAWNVTELAHAFDAGAHPGTVPCVAASMAEAADLQAAALLDETAVAAEKARAAAEIAEKKYWENMAALNIVKRDQQAKAAEAAAAARRAAARKIADKGAAPPGLTTITEGGETATVDRKASKAPTPAKGARCQPDENATGASADDSESPNTLAPLVRLPTEEVVRALYPESTPTADAALLRRLLEALFLESHVCEPVISDRALDEAALAVEMPTVLAEFRMRAAKGHRAVPPTAGDVRRACYPLSERMKQLLETMRDAIARDEMPVLRRVSAAPLQAKAELHVQELFTARALCDESTRLPGEPPWRWDAHWANTLAIGAEIGTLFSRGLLHSAGVGSSVEGHLSLRGQIGGDRLTALRAVLMLTHSLTSIDLSCNGLRDGARRLADGLRSNMVVRSLNLASNDFGAFGAEHIARMLRSNAKLTELDLSDNRLTDDGRTWSGVRKLCDALWDHSSLCSLMLVDNRLEGDGALVMAGMLQANTTIEHLDLQANQISNEGVDGLASAIAKSVTLKSLNLGRNHIDETGARDLAAGLLENTSLTSLDLSVNAIGPVGAMHMAKVLKSNQTLRELNLQANQLQEEAAVKLTDALRRSSTLMSLYLDGNMLFGGDGLGVSTSNRGVLKVSEMLRTNETLTTLGLGNTGLSTDGVKMITDALKANRGLTSLNLHSNHLRREVAECLAEALRSTTTLRSMNLQYNGLHDAAQALLIDAAGSQVELAFGRER